MHGNHSGNKRHYSFLLDLLIHHHFTASLIFSLDSCNLQETSNYLPLLICSRLCNGFEVISAEFLFVNTQWQLVMDAFNLSKDSFAVVVKYKKQINYPDQLSTV